MKRTIVFVTFVIFVKFCLPNVSIAQSNSSKQYLFNEAGIRSSVGYLMAHHSQMLYLVQGHFKAVEVYMEKPFSGNKDWHKAYRIPVFGMDIMAADLGNKLEMGYAFSITSYIKNHLILRKKFEMNSRLDGGIAWLTKKFNRVDNNKNSAIAGGLNVGLNIGFDFEYKFNKLDLGLGISFIHYSNGAYKTPNLGFNFPAISINAGYKFSSSVLQNHDVYDKSSFNKTNNFEVLANVGWKEIMPSNGPKYLVSTLQVGYRRQFNIKSSFMTFAELNNNPSYVKSYENWYKKDVDANCALRAGIGIGYGIMYGNFMLLIEKGVYLYDKLDYDGLFFHRIGGKYYFKNGLVANFSLRTHFAKADVVELGVGWNFCNKR